MDRIIRFLADHSFPARIEGTEVVFEIPLYAAGRDYGTEVHRVRTLTEAAERIGY